MTRRTAGLLALAILGASCGGGGSAAVGAGQAAPPTTQETQCTSVGWSRETVPIAGLQRLVLWKAPSTWTKGAIVVMHGGGGSHTHFCVANVSLIAPQVRFTEMALARGFAVFLLDSSDQVTDNQGRLCGKVWDDEMRDRANLDLPFIGDVLQRLVPGKRPAGSRAETFLVGHSSGGYMAVRAGTQLAVPPRARRHQRSKLRGQGAHPVAGAGLPRDSALHAQRAIAQR